MLGLTKAIYLEDYKINITFNDGTSGTVDLKDTVLNDKRPIFAPLKKIAIFKKFTLSRQTLEWPNQLDLAPEFLFYQAFKNDPEFKEKFSEWGYIDDAQS